MNPTPHMLHTDKPVIIQIIMELVLPHCSIRQSHSHSYPHPPANQSDWQCKSTLFKWVPHELHLAGRPSIRWIHSYICISTHDGLFVWPSVSLTVCICNTSLHFLCTVFIKHEHTNLPPFGEGWSFPTFTSRDRAGIKCLWQQLFGISVAAVVAVTVALASDSHSDSHPVKASLRRSTLAHYVQFPLHCRRFTLAMPQILLRLRSDEISSNNICWRVPLNALYTA